MSAPPPSPGGASLAMASAVPKPRSIIAPSKAAKASGETAPKPSGVVRSKTFRRKCPLPSLKDIAWEAHKAGGWECWYVPNKTQKRSEKVYLGYVGKRLLKTWLELGKEERRAAVLEWVNEKRKGKGIE